MKFTVSLFLSLFMVCGLAVLSAKSAKPSTNDNANNIAQLQAAMPQAFVSCTVVSNTPTVQAQYNVASVISGTAGEFLFTFSDALSNTAYAVAVTSDAYGATVASKGCVKTRTTSSCTVSFFTNSSGTDGLLSPCGFNVAVFGGK
jgi:hypothetical protein